jgi:hypothetical protein
MWTCGGHAYRKSRYETQCTDPEAFKEGNVIQTKKKKLVAIRPQANYTDRMTAVAGEVTAQEKLYIILM